MACDEHRLAGVAAEFQSILIGTAGLTVAALVALVFALSRGVPTRRLPAVRRLTVLGVLAHGSHFAEEVIGGFNIRFPELLGLAPWPLGFFLGFNLAWMALWLGCVPALRRFPRAAGFPVWFLGIASVANGVVHPVLSLAVSGYFPGLWTAPVAGVLGVLLLRALSSRPLEAGAVRSR